MASDMGGWIHFSGEGRPSSPPAERGAVIAAVLAGLFIAGAASIAIAQRHRQRLWMSRRSEEILREQASPGHIHPIPVEDRESKGLEQ